MGPCEVNGTMKNQTDECFSYLMWCFFPTGGVVPPLALPLNALVIQLLLSKPGVCCTSEIFTLHLAIFDVLFCLVVFAEYIVSLCIQTYGAVMFLAWSLNHIGRPVLLCLLSLDSYMAVCRPVAFLRLKDPKLRLSLCLLVNVFTVIWCWLMKSFNMVKWVMVPLFILSALLVTFICNILVLRSLRQTGPSKKAVHPLKRRAFNIVLTSFLLIKLHYLPTLLEMVLRNSLAQMFLPISYLTCVSVTLLSTSSIVQPLCYLTRVKKLTKMGRHCVGSAARTKGA